ncbi:MAG: Dihydrolipoyllysine-residue (2-methylpropanoyl)transferase [Gammaproteobacteria bacterium]|jgi:pyruvate dehydrogenase E2 component (dihydrolipoamide acetyltransferase)|nr:Dihydrolipoyllysine-residue (2-methylpropanoyl)transferase [Gammaproteobacteria bacterium]
MTIFKLPDLGEGLPDAEIHAWHVKVGDSVKVDQLLVSVETAKAVVDVPSPCAGKIKKLYGNVGDIIATGGPLVEFEASDAPIVSKEMPKSHDKGSVAGRVQVGDAVIEENPLGIVSHKVKRADGIKVLPAVRNMARQLGVDLTQVKGSGIGGNITLDDVKKAAVGEVLSSAPKSSTAPEGYESLRGVRRAMAQAMAQSHREVVPVTIIDDAKLYQWRTKQDITARVVRALCKACAAEPALNAHFDTSSMSRKLFAEVNLGVALDSPDGLFVPVIKNAAKATPKKIREIIDQYKKQVGDRSIPKENLQGATIMLSNFGMFAGRYATPIIVPPLVAILGCGRIQEQVIVVDGGAEIHRVMPLSLTFDHRAITGGEATRFLGTFIADLEKAK